MSSSTDKIEDLEPKIAPAAGADSRTRVLERACILVCDDSAQDRALIERELRRVTGELTVISIRDATELDSALTAHTFDLAITDYQLHWSTGLEVLKRLKQHDAQLPVVMFTGSGSEEIAVAAMKEGLDDYVTKTVKHYSRLPYVAAAALERSHTRQQLAAARLERTRLLESIADGFYALDREWRFTFINQHALDHFQLSRADVLGKNIWECIPAARASVVETPLARVMSDRRAATFEALSAQTQRWIEIHAFPASDGIAVQFRDITRRKRGEVALRQAEERYRAFVTNSPRQSGAMSWKSRSI